MLQRLEEEIISKGLLGANEKVLVAVSGGPDSVALLHMLTQLAPLNKWELFVIHVDHQLRKTSNQDAEYVRELCQKWNVPCIVKNVDVRKRAQEEHKGYQEVARMLRYEAMEEVARERDIHKVFLAHHGDDQVETVLMHLIRGSGVSGLVGMQERREWKSIEIIRPMLTFTKEEILAYCSHEKLHPRTDESNTNTNYVRNRVRLELIPLLKTYNPHITSAVSSLSEIVKEEEEFWKEHVQKAKEDVVTHYSSSLVSINTSALKDLSVSLQRRTIKLLLNSLMEESGETTRAAVEQIRKLAYSHAPSGRVSLPQRVLAERNYRALNLVKYGDTKGVESFKRPREIQLNNLGITVLTGMIGEIEVIQSTKRLEPPSCQDWAVFDFVEVDFPLIVRTRYSGEGMSCFRMQGTKKVKKIFIEEKVPLTLRERYPIVTDAGNRILWIPGIKRSNLAIVEEKTSTFLYLLWRTSCDASI